MKARALRFISAPEAEWDAVRTELPTAGVILCAHAIPLALLPAVGWGIGTYIFSTSVSGDPASAVSIGIGTFLLCLVSIVLYAFAFNLILPLYGRGRDWRRAFAVAAYASTPVLAAGILLVLPVLIAVGVIALIYGFYLAYLGVQRLLGVSGSDAAEFVAVASVLFAIGSLMLGAFLGWLRII